MTLIVGLVVLALVLAGGGWWLYSHYAHKQTAQAKLPPLIGTIGSTVTALDTAMPEKDQLCTASLARAVHFGALPAGTRLTSNDAEAAQQEGRFICKAQNLDGQYTINIDTSCPGSQDKTCFALDSIQSGDGKWLYRREG
jgi:hypothetical protein